MDDIKVDECGGCVQTQKKSEKYAREARMTDVLAHWMKAIQKWNDRNLIGKLVEWFARLPDKYFSFTEMQISHGGTDDISFSLHFNNSFRMRP